MRDYSVKFSCLASVVVATDCLRSEIERNEKGRQRSAQFDYRVVGGVYENMIPHQMTALRELSEALKNIDGANYESTRLRNGDLWIQLTDGNAVLPWISQADWRGMIYDAEHMDVCAEGTYEQACLAARAG